MPSLDEVTATMKARITELDNEAGRLRQALALLDGAPPDPLASPRVTVVPQEAPAKPKAKAAAKAKPKSTAKPKPGALRIEPGSRLDKILTDVGAHPNSTTREISQRTGIDDTSVTKLLGKLRGVNLIETEKGTGRSEFGRHRTVGVQAPAPAPQSKPAAPKPRAKRQATTNGPSRSDRVLADIQAHPDAIGRDIAARVGIKDTEVYNLARKLEDEGKITREARPGNQPSTFRAVEPAEEPGPVNNVPVQTP